MVSVLTEPLITFAVPNVLPYGISFAPSRALQLVVVTAVVVQTLERGGFRFQSFSRYLWQPYGFFLIYTLFVSMTGLVLGPLYGRHDFAGSVFDFSDIATRMRLLVEIFMIFYQLFYFVMLAPFFLKSEADISEFFRIAFLILFLHFALGWVDWILNPIGTDLIPRSLADGRDVGQRFHGIAGEPRDAAVYTWSIFFFYATYSLFKRGQVKWPAPWITILITVSCLATVSSTFIITVVFGGVLITLFYFTRRGPGSWILYFAVISGAVGLGLQYMIFAFPRIETVFTQYLDYLARLYTDPLQPLPHVIHVSYNNVYPLILRAREVANLEVLPLLLGGGLGSSGVQNIAVYGDFANPNSAAVRMLYDSGIIGWFIFTYSIMRVVSRCAWALSSRGYVLHLAALMMLGGVFAHRTNVWLIWIGLLVAVATYRWNNDRSVRQL